MSTNGTTPIGKGERVRVTLPGPHLGKVGEVVDAGVDPLVIVVDGSDPVRDRMMFSARQLEVIPSTGGSMSIAGPPAIGKGDRVRVVRGPYDVGLGKAGEVVDINLGLRLVDFGPGGGPAAWCHESYLDRIEPDDVEPRPTPVLPGHVVLTDDVGAPVHFRRRSVSAFGTVREGAPGAGLSWILTEGGFVVAVMESATEIAAMLERTEGR